MKAIHAKLYTKETYVMQDIIGELESEYGGKITWKTFSIWYADSDAVLRKYGVFLFLMDGVFRFRDYEHVPRILGYEIKNKNREPFVPFNGSFAMDDIRSVMTVTKKAAIRSIETGRRLTRQAGMLSRIFRDTVLAVNTDDKQYFFQFPDKEFRKLAGK